MLDWSAAQDGYVITARMAGWQVWQRSQLFGCPALSYALERFINDISDVQINVRFEINNSETQ